jgi:hypothetical protein
MIQAFERHEGEHKVLISKFFVEDLRDLDAVRPGV